MALDANLTQQLMSLFTGGLGGPDPGGPLGTLQAPPQPTFDPLQFNAIASLLGASSQPQGNLIPQPQGQPQASITPDPLRSNEGLPGLAGSLDPTREQGLTPFDYSEPLTSLNPRQLPEGEDYDPNALLEPGTPTPAELPTKAGPEGAGFLGVLKDLFTNPEFQRFLAGATAAGVTRTGRGVSGALSAFDESSTQRRAREERQEVSALRKAAEKRDIAEEARRVLRFKTEQDLAPLQERALRAQAEVGEFELNNLITGQDRAAVLNKIAGGLNKLESVEAMEASTIDKFLTQEQIDKLEAAGISPEGVMREAQAIQIQSKIKIDKYKLEYELLENEVEDANFEWVIEVPGDLQGSLGLEPLTGRGRDDYTETRLLVEGLRAHNKNLDTAFLNATTANLNALIADRNSKEAIKSASGNVYAEILGKLLTGGMDPTTAEKLAQATLRNYNNYVAGLPPERGVTLTADKDLPFYEAKLALMEPSQIIEQLEDWKKNHIINDYQSRMLLKYARDNMSIFREVDLAKRAKYKQDYVNALEDLQRYQESPFDFWQALAAIPLGL